jgi:hypothetical protein
VHLHAPEWFTGIGANDPSANHARSGPPGTRLIPGGLRGYRCADEKEAKQEDEMG